MAPTTTTTTTTTSTATSFGTITNIIITTSQSYKPTSNSTSQDIEEISEANSEMNIIDHTSS